MKNKFISRSEEETREMGKAFAESLKEGDVVLLYGELGSGKTQFVKGVAEYFNVKDVTSPTFIIVNEYPGKDPETGNGIQIFHFDLYRVKNTHELEEIGFGEYLNRNAILLIEWPEKALPLLEKFKETFFDFGNKNNIRNITL